MEPNRNLQLLRENGDVAQVKVIVDLVIGVSWFWTKKLPLETPILVEDRVKRIVILVRKQLFALQAFHEGMTCASLLDNKTHLNACVASRSVTCRGRSHSHSQRGTFTLSAQHLVFERLIEPL